MKLGFSLMKGISLSSGLRSSTFVHRKSIASGFSAVHERPNASKERLAWCLSWYTCTCTCTKIAETISEM